MSYFIEMPPNVARMVTTAQGMPDFIKRLALVVERTNTVYHKYVADFNKSKDLHGFNPAMVFRNHITSINMAVLLTDGYDVNRTHIDPIPMCPVNPETLSAVCTVVVSEMSDKFSRETPVSIEELDDLLLAVYFPNMGAGSLLYWMRNHESMDSAAAGQLLVLGLVSVLNNMVSAYTSPQIEANYASWSTK